MRARQMSAKSLGMVTSGGMYSVHNTMSYITQNIKPMEGRRLVAYHPLLSAIAPISQRMTSVQNLVALSKTPTSEVLTPQEFFFRAMVSR